MIYIQMEYTFEVLDVEVVDVGQSYLDLWSVPLCVYLRRKKWRILNNKVLFNDKSKQGASEESFYIFGRVNGIQESKKKLKKNERFQNKSPFGS
jgi:hypothetical protein